MPLTDEQRRQIGIAITAERQPRRGVSNRTTLATGAGARGRNRYLVLADAGGRLTDAGRYYYRQTGQPAPRAAYDRNQPLITRGSNDYMRAANGRERLVRGLGSDGSVRVTALGRDYFRDKRTEHIVHVPVVIEGRRANGQSYTRRSNAGTGEQTHLPVSRLGVGQILESSALTREQAAARVRSRVLRELGLRTQGGQTVLMEVSGETYLYDRDGEWLISSMSTTTDAAGNQDTEVLLRQPMAGLRSAAAHLPHPELICESAFEEHDDNLCVPRQLSELLRRPLREVCDSFDAALDGEQWRAVGVTGEELQKWCALFGHPLYLVGAGRLLLSL